MPQRKKPQPSKSSKPRLSKAQRESVKAIKAKGYSPAYEKRLLRGVQQGKSRQATRGHKPKEHIERREKERARHAGLTGSNIASIKKFHSEFDPNFRKREPSLDQMVEFAQENGYRAFMEYRKEWRYVRKNYLKELDNGTYISRGVGFLELMSDSVDVPDISWLYYH